MSITLHLTPPPLFQAFARPIVEVACNGFADLEDAACNAYLLWQAQYPCYDATLKADGAEIEVQALNRRLFGH